MSTYTLAEATRRCAYRRVNTFREKFLATADARAALVVGLDEHGRLRLDAAAVDVIVRALREERAQRGNWRKRNLGHYARIGRGAQGFTEAGTAEDCLMIVEIVANPGRTEPHT